MVQEYTQHSISELVELCIEKDLLVSPEILDDKAKLVSLLQESIRKVDASQNTVTVLQNYTKKPKKWTTQDFVRYFNSRFKVLTELLRKRKELENVVSINKILAKKDRETVAVIGLVLDKKETKSGHTLITLEDRTGQIDVWIHSKNKKLLEIGKEVVFDEVIGIVGQLSGNRIFADSVIFPDTPLHKELKKGTTEKYVAFMGDVEVGAKMFLKEEFEECIQWLSGNVGNEENERSIAKKVGYVVFIGDLVHGGGIYPGQHNDQDILDVREQYKEFAKYVQRIPSHIQIVFIAGNHDAGRLQEPQLPLYKDLAPELYEMPNVHILSNPSTFTIDKSPLHPGFDVLAYHGYSLIYYSDTVKPIREAGGQKASEKIMQILLKKRHLAPTHKSNTYVPDPEEDPLVISKVPDFFITGHIHRIAYGTYNNITMINCGCWNDASDEQLKRGLEPQPAKLPLVNLKTRKLKIMNFYKGRRNGTE